MTKVFHILMLLILLGCSNKSNGQMDNQMSIKYFENSNFNNLKEEYLTKTINFEGNKITIELNFDSNNPKDLQLNYLNSFLNNLNKIGVQNFEKIHEEFESSNNNIIKEYLKHHLENIPKKQLSLLINVEEKNSSKEAKLLRKLKLQRISIQPEDLNNYAIFDYSIGENFSQYLIVISTDKDGKIINITIES